MLPQRRLGIRSSLKQGKSPFRPMPTTRSFCHVGERWRFIPVVCACMTMGSPQVDLVALIDVSELVAPAIKPAHVRSKQGVAREDGITQGACDPDL
jgi:hypothetical protein